MPAGVNPAGPSIWKRIAALCWRVVGHWAFFLCQRQDLFNIPEVVGVLDVAILEFRVQDVVGPWRASFARKSLLDPLPSRPSTCCDELVTQLLNPKFRVPRAICGVFWNIITGSPKFKNPLQNSSVYGGVVPPSVRRYIVPG